MNVDGESHRAVANKDILTVADIDGLALSMNRITNIDAFKSR